MDRNNLFREVREWGAVTLIKAFVTCFCDVANKWVKRIQTVLFAPSDMNDQWTADATQTPV